MRKKTTGMILAACVGAMLLTGCENEQKKIFEQAGKDLEQGSYEYALQGYEASVANEVKLPQSYRGAGIANLRMGNYDEAIQNFTDALNCEKVNEALQKDLYAYRATAQWKAGYLENAMADCQSLAGLGELDANGYFLTGQVALSMDSYDEAAMNFENAYGADSTYDMAIRIYQTYLEKGMEADGTRYLEAALTREAKTPEDFCNRGRAYYYMEDYANAQKELITAVNQNNTEAMLLLGMVYLAQQDPSNARAMYQQYTANAGESGKGYNGLALCDMAEGNYDSALNNIAAGIPLASTEELQSLLFNEIVVYEKKLDFGTALVKAQEYLEMFPGDEEVEREMKFLKSRVQ